MFVIDQALLAFVIANRRLPCPADGTALSGAVGAGVEARNGSGDCGQQTTGVVPWVTLGLSEADATDGFFTRFTYRVPDGASGVTRDGSMDAANCDPAGGAATTLVGNVNGCNPFCDRSTSAARTTTCTSATNILSGRGLRVLDGGGNAISEPSGSGTTGAAYVVISHMAEGGGGYISTGIIPAPIIAAGTNEALNANGQDVRTSPAAYFHGNNIFTGESAGANHFDDLVSHPSVSQLMVKAQLAPRSQ